MIVDLLYQLMWLFFSLAVMLLPSCFFEEKKYYYVDKGESAQVIG
jgi:hypothetical protein